MNLNDRELEIYIVRNDRMSYTKMDYSSPLKITNQISCILLRPINRDEVIIKTTSKKPK